jgi:hypothetical protein
VLPDFQLERFIGALADRDEKNARREAAGRFFAPDSRSKGPSEKPAPKTLVHDAIVDFT